MSENKPKFVIERNIPAPNINTTAKFNPVTNLLTQLKPGDSVVVTRGQAKYLQVSAANLRIAGKFPKNHYFAYRSIDDKNARLWCLENDGPLRVDKRAKQDDAYVEAQQEAKPVLKARLIKNFQPEPSQPLPPTIQQVVADLFGDTTFADLAQLSDELYAVKMTELFAAFQYHTSSKKD